MKVCRYCEKEKPLEDFNKHSHGSDGYDNRCKECTNEDKRTRHQLHRENKHTKTEECEMCGKIEEKKGGTRLDHEHDTNLPISDRFRGWLCDDCNVGLGRLGDNREAGDKIHRYFDKVEARRNGGLFAIN